MAGTPIERAHERQDQPGESPAEYLERYGEMRPTPEDDWLPGPAEIASAVRERLGAAAAS